MHPGGHLAPAEVAPAVPAIGFGLATLATFTAWAVCLGLAVAWRHTLGFGMRWVSNHIRGVGVNVIVTTIHPFDFLADVLDTINENIANALATAALNTEHAAIWCFHETERTAVEAAKLIYDATLETYRWAVHFENVTMPHFVHAAEHRVGNLIHSSTITAERFARREAHAEALRIEKETKLARHEIHAARVAIEAETLPRIKGLEGDFSGLRADVRRIAKQLTAGGVVALVITALGTLGLGWLRCGNVKNVGKRICGLNPDLLEALLGGLLAVEGTVSLVALGNELVGLAGEIVPAVTGFVREFKDVPLRTAHEQGFE